MPTSSKKTKTHKVLLPGCYLLAGSMISSLTYSEITHDFNIGSRARFVNVEEGSTSGKSVSLLLRANLESKWNENISSIFEYDHVETGLKDQHNDGLRANNKPLIPDVPGGEINLAYLYWQGRQMEFTVGRQSIELANQRFVGNTSYWQNEQSFDAFRSRLNFLSMSSVQYIYIDKANTYWGDKAGSSQLVDDPIYGLISESRPSERQGNQDHNTHLLHMELKEWDYSQVFAWYYNIENSTAEHLSSKTFGLAYRFSFKSENLKYFFEADIAEQNRTFFADNSIPYHRVETGLGFQSLQLMLSQEMLGSDRNWAFVTPLASTNNFQGWANRFISTPSAGIVDNRIQLDWRFTPVRVDARYHSFRSAENSEAFGKEFDLDFIWKISRKNTVSLRYADFQSEHSEIDDFKSLSLSWSFNL